MTSTCVSRLWDNSGGVKGKEGSGLEVLRILGLEVATTFKPEKEIP